jgi:GDP-4-dehydro-6-deoxy-D-mannose reductase
MRDVVIVTGAGGFVGRRLVAHLASILGAGAEIHAWFRKPHGAPQDANVQHRVIDITDGAAVRAEIALVRPTGVFHLAGSARTRYEPADFGAVWLGNLDGTLSIARALLEEHPQGWLLNVSSGLVYGATAGDTPVSELSPPAPAGPYASSKYAAEVAVDQLRAQGLRSVTVRPFNHSGPGQGEDFLVPALVGRVLRERDALHGGVLTVRNIHHIRDFLHVDDVVEAYAALYARRDHPGLAPRLNLCSGAPVSVGEIADEVLAACGVRDCRVVQQMPPDLAGPPVLVGDNAALLSQADWRPRRDWRVMVLDTVAWRESLLTAVAPRAVRQAERAGFRLSLIAATICSQYMAGVW